MMGRSHLMLGAAGYLAFETLAPEVLPFAGQLDTAQLAAGTLIAAGAAMLPDLDHPQATLARSLPPVSNALSHFVHTIAGGHRKGTHTIWAWLGFSALSWFALTQIHAGPLIGLIFAIFCSLLMFQVLTEAHGLVSLILACMIGGAAVLAAGPDFGWMVEAIFIGYFLHLVGDVVTTEGIPPFWPLPPQVRFPILGSTDHWRERSAGIACGLIAFYFAVTAIFIPGWQNELNKANDNRLSEKTVKSRIVAKGQAKTEPVPKKTATKNTSPQPQKPTKQQKPSTKQQKPASRQTSTKQSQAKTKSN